MCDKCGMTFYHNSNLKKHIETVHAVQHKVTIETDNFVSQNKLLIVSVWSKSSKCIVECRIMQGCNGPLADVTDSAGNAIISDKSK